MPRTRTCSCRARPAAKAGLATSARNVGWTSLLRWTLTNRKGQINKETEANKQICSDNVMSDILSWCVDRAIYDAWHRLVGGVSAWVYAQCGEENRIVSKLLGVLICVWWMWASLLWWYVISLWMSSPSRVIVSGIEASAWILANIVDVRCFFHLCILYAQTYQV